MTTLLHSLFSQQHRCIPPPLKDWDFRVADWCNNYREQHGQAQIVEIPIDSGVFIFDLHFERVILAYALSIKQEQERDTSRMRGFPNVNASFQKTQRGADQVADKGHFLSHASGGGLDINLFPHERHLNRGWSEAGKRFRAMEKHTARHPGTFYFHRACYEDDSWVPAQLHYGVLKDESEWWEDTFDNTPIED